MNFTLRKPVVNAEFMSAANKYKVTLPAGQTIEMEADVFRTNFMTYSTVDKNALVLAKLREIKNLEVQLADDNGDALFLDALDKVNEIMKLL
jgi:hypothetical protein